MYIFELANLFLSTMNQSNQFYLSQGQFGEVFKGRYQGVDVAIKTVLTDASNSCRKELEVMSKLKDNNIVGFITHKKRSTCTTLYTF